MAAFGIHVAPFSDNVNWSKYSHVARARIRRATLIGLSAVESRTDMGQTATTIRKHVRCDHAVGLNPILRALKDLRRLCLVRDAGVTRLRSCQLYRLTLEGRRIVALLRQ